MRNVTWDANNRVWSPWPTNWTTFTVGNEPLLTLYKLDDNGYKFRVDMFVNNQEFTFDVTYTGFDATNNWSKYKDDNGDEVMLVGSTMSNLSQFGWPDTKVDLYLWIYSKGMAFEME